LNAKTVLELIGNTPLVKTQHLTPNPNVQIYLKLEKQNPGGSIKDRIAKYMIEQAEQSGQLKRGQTVIEATSGNTGIGIALVCRAKGYDCVIIMPESMSVERRKVLVSFGAKVLLTDAERGMDGAETVAKEIAAENPAKYFMPNQSANPANTMAHYETTGPEIWRDTDGKITHLFAGIGTTGTLMGISKYLKEHNPTVQAIGVQPEIGATIQGLKDLKTYSTPKIFDPKFIDEIQYVHPQIAEETTRLLSLQEGLFVGSSSGAIFYAAMQKAKTLREGVLVCIAPDGGEKYLSTALCDPDCLVECVRKNGVQCSYCDGKPVSKVASTK
jgi:cysteine synthase